MRSFGGDSEEVLQFGTPLTLIVGQNGSGKTSIIECLRYATTGEVPPNTNKGVSFVTDPHLGSGRETMAHIKLAFKTSRGKQMILTKNMSCAINNRTKGLSFKTRENQLKAIDSFGNKETMSSKVTDIEKLIPQMLGVNKAILEYVVFCHQEESLWPISDSASLKKKFDEIFDSVKFIDALNEMKDISKKLNLEIKELNLVVNHLLEDKKRYLSKVNSLKELKLQTDQIENNIFRTKELIDETNNQLVSLHNSNQDFEQIINKMSSLKQQKDSIEGAISRIESTTEIINIPSEELKSQLNDFANVVLKQRQQINSMNDQKDVFNDQMSKFRNKLDQLLTEGGKLKLNYENNQLNYQKRNDLYMQYMNQVAASSNEDFDIKLDFKISSITTDLSTKTTFFENKIEEKNTQIQNTKNEQTKVQQHQLYLKQDIQSNENKKLELNNRLISISNNRSKLKTLKQELSEKEFNFEKSSYQNDIDKLDEEIDGLQKIQIPQNELALEKIQLDMKVSRANSEISSKIIVLKDLKKSSARYLDNLKENISSELPDLSLTEGAQIFQNKLTSLETENGLIKSNQDSIRERINQLKYSLQNNELKMADSNIQLNKLTLKTNLIKNEYYDIYDVELHVNKIDDELSKIEESFENDVKMIKFREFLIDYYQTAVKYAETEGACKLCNTQLHEDGQDEEDEQFYLDFIKRLKKLQLKYEQQNTNDKELNSKRKFVANFRNSKFEFVQLNQLKNDIDQLSKTIVSQKNELLDQESQLKQTNDKFNKSLNELNKWKLISEDVKSYFRVKAENDEHDQSIAKLESQLASKGLSMSNEELEEEHKRLIVIIKAHRRSIETMRFQRDNWNTLKNETLRDINEMKLKINDLELKSLDKVNIEKAIKETDEQLLKLNDILKSSNLTLSELSDSLADLLDENKKLVSERDSELNSIKSDLSKYQSIKDTFKNVNESISLYESNFGDDQYSKSQQDIAKCKQDISNLEDKIGDSNQMINSLEMKLANSNDQERNIRFNIDLLDYKSQLAEVEEQMDSIDIEQAKLRKSEYLIQSNDLQNTLMSYQTDVAGKLGEKTQIEKQIGFINSEIQRDYKDIDKRHAEKFMELQTKLALSTDLNICYKATDDSILKYHHTQMDKINNIIDELWKKTYMGNDIETIQIKSDPIASKTPSKAGTTAKNNRSYNYRVVMVKNGSELDMRGRCSAGQKVLASIIIRIALAECFGTSFGMIALDEPTTNLDEENIESLARALHKIIQDRMEQRNFQLIIITHDEKFLRMLNAVDFTDYYYKVQRNERLNSYISKVKINSITN